NDAFFIGALVKGWGEFSHGLYCCEQSDSAFSSHHPFEYHHTSGFAREEAGTGEMLTSIFCFAAFAARQLPLSPPKAEGLCRFSGITLAASRPASPYFRGFCWLAQHLLYLAQRYSGQPPKVSPT
ncbi:hypothetical protein, partial [Pseudomonas plecoglossicida]|uniref:hypothetical protein n=1 Tax=Pseudomonas plecoglossicida TaxID=70775 RepID=UPI001C62CF4C